MQAKSISQTGYNYATIKITQSRIDKGLLAIPVALIGWFPKQNCRVQVLFNESSVPQQKNYTSYSSRSRECRIGGLVEWFQKNKIKEGEEIVLQVIDKDKHVYRLIPEQHFVAKSQQIQNEFDASENEQEASKKLIEIANWTKAEEDVVKLSEFHRLLKQTEVNERKISSRREFLAKESVPTNIRVLLGRIYLGHCQVCDFWFLKKDKLPYFEIHHVEPRLGQHLKNLIVVCGNCHNQFTYAEIKEDFKDGWLYRVLFNDKTFEVNQIVLKQKFTEAAKETFIEG